MNKKTILSVLLVIGPILLGFGIYFSCRSSSLLYYQWLPFKKLIDVGPAKDYAWRKCSEILGAGVIHRAIIFSIPAALFAFSLTYYLKIRYFRKTLRNLNGLQNIAAFLIAVTLIAFVPEYLQLLRVLPGHFDVTDVIAAGLAIVLALYIF